MCKYLGFLFIYFLSISLFGSTDKPQVLEFYNQGKESADNGSFTQSLRYLNQALGFLRQSSSTHPMRIAIEKEIRIVKGKSLVARYQDRMKLNNKNFKAQPLSLDQEPADIEITQFYGKILAREVWHSIEVDDSRNYLGFNRRITVLPKSGIELFNKNNSSTLRTVDAASFIISKNGNYELHTGSYCIYSTKKNNAITINSPLSTVGLSSKTPYACMVGVTTNGGLKIINLLGEIYLEKTDFSVEIVPGQLIFSLPKGFSRKMSLELSTLMVTSNLLTKFESPPVFYKKLRQQAMLQALKTRKRYKTVIGDVKDRENFQIKVLEEK